MRDDVFIFAPERKLYEQLRPLYDDDECLFVPNTSHDLAGYVTFDRDAHRLHVAVKRLGLPLYIARTFQGSTVLWLIDATAERTEALADLSACSVYFAFEGPWDARQQNQQETDLLQDPWQ